MDDKTTYYNGLIAAYFSGETTPEEVELLSLWLTADKANLELFEKSQKVWLLTGKVALTAEFDLDAEWKSLAARMAPEISSAPAPSVSSGKGRLISLVSGWKAAAALVVLLAAAAVLFYMNSSPDMVVITADSDNTELVLPDGSVISLYKGSQVEYPEEFNEGKRRVKLDGEAYFNVTHDKKHPFVVSGNDARIEVLGTAFNVNTKAGKDRINVVLTSGKVSLYFSGKKSERIVLNPGEKAEISTSEKSIITAINADPNYMAWKTKELSFENTSLDKVVVMLSKVYNTEIRLANEKLAGCSLTATFDKQPLSAVLNVIMATLDVRVTEQNGLMLVEGSGCESQEQ